MSVLMSGGGLLAVGLLLVSVIAGVFYVRVISVLLAGEKLWELSFTKQKPIY